MVTRNSATLFIAAHPDDIETMMAYAVLRTPGPRFALVATDGEGSTRNHTGDSRFVSDRHRRGESQRGLAALGIPYSHQSYPGLPDRELNANLDVLTAAITATLTRHDIRQIFTMGPQGFDGHTDHVATHAAAVAALRGYGHGVNMFALNENHQGRRVAPAKADIQATKLAAMTHHRSQFPIVKQANGQGECIGGHFIPADLWLHLRPYHPLLLRAETYDSILVHSGKTSSRLVQ